MKVISLISILFFSGCVITGIDKPSSYDYELWWKNGASTVEVQMAMLECGYHSIYWNASMSVVEVIESNRCMEGIGFEKKKREILLVARLQRYPNIPRARRILCAHCAVSTAASTAPSARSRPRPTPASPLDLPSPPTPSWRCWRGSGGSSRPGPGIPAHRSAS